MPAEPERFAHLFDHPSIEGMYDLPSKEFEHFVAYVLRRAGFDVKEVGPHFLRGLDLELRLPGKTRIFGGIECKRFASDNLVPTKVVTGVRGAPAVGKPGAKPFVIATSDFSRAASQMADAAKPVYLLNGTQFMRYITYVRGSKFDDDDALVSLSPEFFATREQLPPRTGSSTTILTIANNKGGVGKTTTAYYLGAELARQGKRVLLIDLDGQGNLTERCLPDLVARRSEDGDHFASIAHYFARERTLSDLIVPAEMRGGMSLIPSDPFLTLRDMGGSGRPDVELRFARDVEGLCSEPIASLGGTPDWIILDTPPALSLFTRAGLAAADYVVAPVRPRIASLAGTTNMLRMLRTMNALMQDRIQFLGAAITHWDNLVLTKNFAEVRLPRALRTVNGAAFETTIPIDNQLDTLEPGANTGGARCYEALAREVVSRINERRQNGHHDRSRQDEPVSVQANVSG